MFSHHFCIKTTWWSNCCPSFFQLFPAFFIIFLGFSQVFLVFPMFFPWKAPFLPVIPMVSARLLELLLSLGCPVERRDGDGLTAAQRATQRGRHDLALLIDGYAEEGFRGGSCGLIYIYICLIYIYIWYIYIYNWYIYIYLIYIYI